MSSTGNLWPMFTYIELFFIFAYDTLLINVYLVGKDWTSKQAEETRRQPWRKKQKKKKNGLGEKRPGAVSDLPTYLLLNFSSVFFSINFTEQYLTVMLALNAY